MGDDSAKINLSDSQEDSLETTATMKVTNDPLHVFPSDNPGVPLVTDLLDSSNFLSWQSTIKMALGAKNKLGMIDGSIKCPELGTERHRNWLRADYLVRSWILNSMTPQIKITFRTNTSAKKLWDELQIRFGESNAPQIFELKRSLHAVTQQNQTITEYFGQLKKIWEDIDSIEGMPSCTCGAFEKCTCKLLERLWIRQEKHRLMEFLNGLSEAYENVIDTILSMEDLPYVNRAYHLALQVERKKKTTMLTQPSHDASALAAAGKGNNNPGKQFVFGENGQFGQGSGNFGGKKENRDFKKARLEAKADRKCTYCFKKGHTVDQCFRLYGYSDWYKGPRDPAIEKIGKMRAAGMNTFVPVAHDDTPLDKNISIAPVNSTTPDFNLVSAVCHEVLKAIQSQSGSQAHTLAYANTNSAGPYH